MSATRSVRATGNADFEGTNASIEVVWSTRHLEEVGLSVVDHTNGENRSTAFLTIPEALELMEALNVATTKLRIWGATS